MRGYFSPWTNYESFKTCSEVNIAFEEMLSSTSFQRKAKSVFYTEILEDEKKMLLASREGNVEDVGRLLSSGMVDVNCAGGKYQSTPLCEAAYHGNTDVVRILLDRGAEHDRADKHGQTALYGAAERGHKDALLLLIDRGAHPDTADKYGQTPLHGAALNGRKEVVKLLLDRGAAHNQAGLGRSYF